MLIGKNFIYPDVKYQYIADLLNPCWRQVINMEKGELAEGKYVQFLRSSFRIGRVSKIGKKWITVILAPYMSRGKNKGAKLRIDKKEIIGIIYKKKVIPWTPMK